MAEMETSDIVGIIPRVIGGEEKGKLRYRIFTDIVDVDEDDGESDWLDKVCWYFRYWQSVAGFRWMMFEMFYIL